MAFTKIRTGLYQSGKALGDISAAQKMQKKGPKGVFVQIFGDDLLRTINKAVGPSLDQVAEAVQLEAIRSMKQAPKPGVPSRPGRPPHRQTGNLAASIKRGFINDQTVVVGPTLQGWYGRRHEYGKQETVPPFRYWPPRPFMRPAFDKVSRMGIDEFFEHLDLVRHAVGKTRRKRSKISQARSKIYQTAKIMGDISSIADGTIVERIAQRQVGKMSTRGMSSAVKALPTPGPGTSRAEFRSVGYVASRTTRF